MSVGHVFQEYSPGNSHEEQGWRWEALPHQGLKEDTTHPIPRRVHAALTDLPCPFLILLQLHAKHASASFERPNAQGPAS